MKTTVKSYRHYQVGPSPLSYNGYQEAKSLKEAKQIWRELKTRHPDRTYHIIKITVREQRTVIV